MKKRIFLLNAWLCLALSLWAVPAKRGVWRSVPLMDGTEVRVQLVGDEFSHFYVSEDGTKYVEDASTGLYRKLTDEAQRRKGVMARRAKVQKRQATRLRKAQSASRRSSLFQGTKKGLVILAEFTDKKFATGHNLSLYKQIVNGDNYQSGDFRGSVKDYFKAQSQGQFTLDFDVVGICPLSKSYAYYGKNTTDSYGNDTDQHAGEMVAEACQWAHQQGVDFSQYDWDGDGEVDQVFVLYAGKGEADGGAESTVWPHMYYLSVSDYGKALTFNGVKVDTYACSAELNGNSDLDGIGTFCHEFSHCMGFPDLYDTSYSGWFGMGDFDLMNSGSYNGDGRCPAGYSAYEKNECGWITLHDMTDIDSENKVSGLAPVSEGGDAYVIHNKGHQDEYYVVENRQKTNWDASLPDAGVMITHVDYNEYVWGYNVPNTKDTYYDWDDNDKEYTNDHQRLTIFHADNKSHGSYDYGHVGDLYGNKYTSLTSTSTPAATLYSKNSDGTKYMHIDITDIAVASDGTASMTFTPADHNGGGETPDTPVVPDGSTLLYESFNNCDGKGGNDGEWSGNVAGSEASSDEFDNNGWTSTGKIYSADGCVRLGTSGNVGNITSPAITVDGSVVLTFKAGAWDGGKDGTALNLSVSNGKISDASVTMKKGSWTSYSTTITAKGTTKITFAAQKGRFFLDEVRVTAHSSTGIENVETEEKSSIIGYYSLDGTRLNAPTPGICIIRYADGTVKKIIKK